MFARWNVDTFDMKTMNSPVCRHAHTIIACMCIVLIPHLSTSLELWALWTRAQDPGMQHANIFININSFPADVWDRERAERDNFPLVMLLAQTRSCYGQPIRRRSAAFLLHNDSLNMILCCSLGLAPQPLWKANLRAPLLVCFHHSKQVWGPASIQSVFGLCNWFEVHLSASDETICTRTLQPLKCNQLLLGSSTPVSFLSILQCETDNFLCHIRKFAFYFCPKKSRAEFLPKFGRTCGRRPNTLR